jgi:hypothetical protein
MSVQKDDEPQRGTKSTKAEFFMRLLCLFVATFISSNLTSKLEDGRSKLEDGRWEIGYWLLATSTADARRWEMRAGSKEQGAGSWMLDVPQFSIFDLPSSAFSPTADH